MRRIWANLYFNEAEAGNTFQATLNDVVDWLAKHDGEHENASRNVKGLAQDAAAH